MKECIILAGGFGTRLQSVVKDVPKCMAEVAGKPFLKYILDYIQIQGFRHVILSLGYKAEIVLDWIGLQDYNFRISHTIEDSPLGTGGAIKFAFEKVMDDKAAVLNGDTYFDVDCDDLYSFHETHDADLSLALKPMKDFDRYGSVELNENNRIIRFNEKQGCKEGLINGGVYIINRRLFSQLNLPERFSFEKNVMEDRINDLNIYGCIQDRYFIDIGIPEDFEKANKDFSTWK